jgi:glyoxylase-like metal-dependent hydrolase (beta-lactamase superfamily II)
MVMNIIRIDLDGVNSYLCKMAEGFVLIDTGGHLSRDKQFVNRREKLENELKKAGCEPGSLKLVVLTHGDSDHTANAAYIREKYRAMIAMHAGDAEMAKAPTPERMMENFRFRMLRYRIMSPFVKKLVTRVIAKQLSDFECFDPDILLEDGSSLLDYGLDARVIHLPGHTDGSIGILLNDGSLISGDTYTCSGKLLPAPNAKDFAALDRSIGRLKGMNIKKIYPGHGEIYTY